jgi:hypothetical protein
MEQRDAPAPGQNGGSTPHASSVAATTAPSTGSRRERLLLLGLAVTMTFPRVLLAMAVWATRAMETNQLEVLDSLWFLLRAASFVVELMGLIIMLSLASLDDIVFEARNRRWVAVAVGAFDLATRLPPSSWGNNALDAGGQMPEWILPMIATCALAFWLSALLVEDRRRPMLLWAIVAAASLHAAVQTMTGSEFPVLAIVAAAAVTIEVLRVRAAHGWRA